MPTSMAVSGACKPAMPYPDVVRGQFLRVEKFAIQAPRGKQGGNTITKVAHEAVRTEGYCPHIAQPEPPTLLYGISPLAAAERAKAWARAQTDYVRHPSSQVPIARKFRVDKPCALVGVISAPPEWTPGDMWTNFCEKSLGWLLRKYGEDRLCTLLEHRDERWLHLHFWVVPRPGESFSAVHQGEAALDAVGRHAARILRDAAYKKAMAQLLDEFNSEVGQHFGLKRLTVGGKRFSRQDWQLKRLRDQKCELDIQHRIDAAVDAATHHLGFDQIGTTANSTVRLEASRPGTSTRLHGLVLPRLNPSSGILTKATPATLSANVRPDISAELTTPVPHQPQLWVRPRNG